MKSSAVLVILVSELICLGSSYRRFIHISDIHLVIVLPKIYFKNKSEKQVSTFQTKFSEILHSLQVFDLFCFVCQRLSKTIVFQTNATKRQNFQIILYTFLVEVVQTTRFGREGLKFGKIRKEGLFFWL